MVSLIVSVIPAWRVLNASALVIWSSLVEKGVSSGAFVMAPNRLHAKEWGA